ncbi:MAG: threonine/serine dehydratase [Candidatus Aminicenantaceae bacterium]
MSDKEMSHGIDVKKEALEAEKRIRKYIRETPVEYSPYFSSLGKCKIFLKFENFQLTGSFKLRGAMSKILSLSEKEKEGGVITASSGNHGAAFAYLVKKFGIKGTIYLPENASPAKIEALRYYNADIKFYANDCNITEIFARETAEKNNQIFISPYNDLKVIGGQATIGIELSKQIKRIDTILVPIGGGSLIAGIAGYLKSIDRDVEIIGCQPENSPVMYESIKAGKIIEVEWKPSISDGTVGGIEEGAITFDICRDYVDDYILVTEDEIKEAIRIFLDKQYMLIEGAAALSVASYLKEKERFKGKNVVLIISGSKIGLDTLKEVLS